MVVVVVVIIVVVMNVIVYICRPAVFTVKHICGDVKAILLTCLTLESALHSKLFSAPQCLLIRSSCSGTYCIQHAVETSLPTSDTVIFVSGCLQLLEILEISWNLKFLLEIPEILSLIHI